MYLLHLKVTWSTRTPPPQSSPWCFSHKLAPLHTLKRLRALRCPRIAEKCAGLTRMKKTAPSQHLQWNGLICCFLKLFFRSSTCLQDSHSKSWQCCCLFISTSLACFCFVFKSEACNESIISGDIQKNGAFLRFFQAGLGRFQTQWLHEQLTTPAFANFFLREIQLWVWWKHWKPWYECKIWCRPVRVLHEIGWSDELILDGCNETPSFQCQFNNKCSYFLWRFSFFMYLPLGRVLDVVYFWNILEFFWLGSC